MNFLPRRSHKFLAALALLLPLPAGACAGGLEVIDGDTIVLNGETVRILNIDAPELHSAKCDAERRLAVLARNRVEQLLERESRITLLRGDHGRNIDRYGRTLARVMTGGRDLGEMLIAEGLARRWDGRRRAWCD